MEHIAIAVDSATNVYVAETATHAIKRVDSVGNITTVAGSGRAGFRSR